jgi:hypothetical protein
MVLTVREQRSEARTFMTTQLHGRADRYGGVGIDGQRSGVFRGARFAQRRLVAFGLGVAMTLPMATMIAAPAASAATATRSVTAAATAKCSTSNVHGVQTISYCGPATATLVVAGKTYSFQNGECQSIAVSHITVDLVLGTIAEGKSGAVVKGNTGKPYFSLDLSPGQNSDLLGNVFFGGKNLTNGGAVSASGTVVSKGTSKGTFKSAKGAYDLLGKPFSVSGSWNCHGAFAKS